jgi:hypothetical protein
MIDDVIEVRVGAGRNSPISERFPQRNRKAALEQQRVDGLKRHAGTELPRTAAPAGSAARGHAPHATGKIVFGGQPVDSQWPGQTRHSKRSASRFAMSSTCWLSPGLSPISNHIRGAFAESDSRFALHIPGHSPR